MDGFRIVDGQVTENYSSAKEWVSNLQLRFVSYDYHVDVHIEKHAEKNILVAVVSQGF